MLGHHFSWGISTARPFALDMGGERAATTVSDVILRKTLIKEDWIFTDCESVFIFEWYFKIRGRHAAKPSLKPHWKSRSELESDKYINKNKIADKAGKYFREMLSPYSTISTYLSVLWSTCSHLCHFHDSSWKASIESTRVRPDAFVRIRVEQIHFQESLVG